MNQDTTSGTLSCNFCGKSQYEVNKLITGTGCCICDECVEICNNVIDEDDKG